MRVKEKSAKASLKLNILKMKIVSYSRNTSWQIDGGKVKKVANFMFLGSKITADINCSHEIQKHLLPRRNTMTNVDSVLKSKDIPLPRKILIVKAMVFPVVMYGCERWTIKKAEHQRIEAFKP